MKLSYKEGKTIVEIDGKQMGVPMAVLKYPKVAKVILDYSQKAKKIARIKTVSVTHYEESIHPNPTIRENVVFPERWVVEVCEKGAKDIRNYATYEETEKALKMLGISKCDDKCYANGKPLTKENYKFMQSYLNDAKCDEATGKITTEVQPNFDVENLCEVKCYDRTVRKPRPEGADRLKGVCYWFSLGKNKVLSIADQACFSHYDPTWDLETDIDLISTPEYYNRRGGVTHLVDDKREIECFSGIRVYRESGYIAKLLQNAGFTDLVDLKVSSLIDATKSKSDTDDARLTK